MTLETPIYNLIIKCVHRHMALSVTVGLFLDRPLCFSFNRKTAGWSYLQMYGFILGTVFVQK